jgi:DNA-binding transcriptional LysR family regulator
MELRHLRYFVTVAEEEHITRAAMRLGMKQPPLSQQIRQLEDEIGVSLFDRHPKRIALNAAGKIFLSDARRILAAAEDAIDRVRKFDLGQEGTILIGMTSSASVHPICIEIVREFRAAQPLVSIQIEEGANHDLLVMLEEERLDFAFVRSGVDRYPLVTCRTLAHEPMVVAIPATHDLAGAPGESLSIRDLASEDWVSYRQSNGAGIHDVLMQACVEAGFKPRIVGTTERVMSAINMVASGFGVTVVPRTAENFRLPNVVYRPLAEADNVTVPLNVAYHLHRASVSRRRFLAVCDDHAAEEEPDRPRAASG